jgi:hypothetical protein
MLIATPPPRALMLQGFRDRAGDHSGEQEYELVFHSKNLDNICIINIRFPGFMVILFQFFFQFLFVLHISPDEEDNESNCGNTDKDNNIPVHDV